MSWRMVLVAALVTGSLAACSDAPAPHPAPPSMPSITLPADMPAMNCADFEPPPVVKPTEKFTGRRCTSPDGRTRWVAGFYQCADGRIWPVLADQPGPPMEPISPEFDKCVGRPTISG